MLFKETSLSGVRVVEPERVVDDRGHFARTFCEHEFEKAGLAQRFVQTSAAYTHLAGTIRGLHYQKAPFWETKLVRCTRGSAFVVAVDIRPHSPTHCHWVGVELTAECGRAIYVPQGFAQGYQTLEDATELLYQMTEFYSPEHASGYRHDDPKFRIEWPLPPRNLSARDVAWDAYPELT